MNSVLPRSCIPTPKIETDNYDWYLRHRQKVDYVRNHAVRVVFLGDSITHFWCGETGTDFSDGFWRELFDGQPVLNLGYGYDRTQNVLWRLEHGEVDHIEPELFILNIGTNQFSISQNYDGDTPEVAVAGIECVLKKIQELFPKAFTVVMALFPRNEKMKDVSAVNRMLQPIVNATERTAWIDLTTELSLPSGTPDPRFFQDDLCHPNRAGYEVWFAALRPYLEKYGRISCNTTKK